MNRRELLQGALLTAAATCAPAALAALPSDPLVSGVRYVSRHPTIDDYYTSGMLMSSSSDKLPLSRFVAALQKHKDFAGLSGWDDFTWTVMP